MTVPRAVRRALFLTAVVSVQRVGVVNAVPGEDPQKPETPKSQGKLALALPDDFPDTCQMQRVTPFLWFDKQAEEAARFYVSIFKNSKIVGVTRYGGAGPGPQGSVMTVTFELGGQEFIALNGGPHFKFTEAISFSVNCKTQEEVDEFWRKHRNESWKRCSR